MGIELLTRTAKRYHEETFLQNTGAQFYNIFDTLDEDDSAAFSLDNLLQDPYAATYRQSSGQAHVRKYVPGTGMILSPPSIGEKTPITGDLRDKVIAGLDSIASWGSHEIKLIGDIVKQHTAAINMQKNYQAMQVFVQGKFIAPGPGGVDIGLEIDFSRSTDQTLTYNFTTAGNTMTKALKAGQDAIIAKGAPKDNMCVIMGDTWLADFAADTEIIAWRQANQVNELLVQDMVPEFVNGIEGLYKVATYRGATMTAPIHVLSYSPPKQYVKDLGETAEDYIADAKAVFFSLSDERFRVNRGVDIIDPSGSMGRMAGELVFDGYVENDPVAMFQRTQTRHAFVYANINHTAVSTGTFA